MAYTRTWDEAAPSGLSSPALIDNFMREGKVDLRERFNDIIGVAIVTALADPIVASNLTLTNLRADLTTAKAVTVAAGQITKNWFGHRYTEVGVAITRQKYNVSGASGTGNLIIPISELRVGVTITKVSVLVDYNNAGHSLTMNFYEMSAAGADITTTNIATPGISASPQWVDSGTVSIAVAADEAFAFELILNNNNLATGTNLAVYRVRVYYNSPNTATR